MRTRSVGPASTDPKSTCASSNSQKRGAAIPWKLTGAGIAVFTISAAAPLGGAERLVRIDVEVVPVQTAVRVLPRAQHLLAIADPRAHRERVLQPFG